MTVLRNQVGAGGRPVLIDAKDWAGYPPTDQDFWHKGTMGEARRQLDEAAAIGGTVRWVFSDQAAADAVLGLFNGRDGIARQLNQIQIVVVPKS